MHENVHDCGTRICFLGGGGGGGVREIPRNVGQLAILG